ncbi:MAG: hypothetical protein NC078_09715 [Ruminococcus sp.]|nr:hypothetical protein [Ruminococcus sp.]
MDGGENLIKIFLSGNPAEKSMFGFKADCQVNRIYFFGINRISRRTAGSRAALYKSIILTGIGIISEKLLTYGNFCYIIIKE